MRRFIKQNFKSKRTEKIKGNIERDNVYELVKR